MDYGRFGIILQGTAANVSELSYVRSKAHVWSLALLESNTTKVRGYVS